MVKYDTNGRRLGVRNPTQMRARVYDAHGRSVEVKMRDISPNGARLLAAADAAIPRQFVIRFAEFEARGEVIWRKGVDVGVRFILPDEDSGRVRPPPSKPAQKASIDDLRSAARPRRGLLRFLFG